MDESNTHAGKENNKIRCIEIILSQSDLERTGCNLRWTLSVYSLENQPFEIQLSEGRGQKFHFMVYDWRRTIKGLLENLTIPYKVTKYFVPDNVYCDPHQKIGFSESDATLVFQNTTVLDKGDHSGKSLPRPRDSYDVPKGFVYEETDA